jgi:Predicted membrane protein
MIKEEWKYLLKHKLMVIVFAVMIFIPSIYSVTFLKSMWDPYGQLKNLPVAVVNNDKSVNYQGTDLKVGKDLTKN